MADNISDDQLSQFLAFTGSSDPNIARQYLEMSGNQLEMAVSLFMDHNNGTGASASSGGGGSNSAAGLGGMGSPEVRAPDATRSMRLVGGPPSPGGNDYRNAAAQAALMAAVGGPNAAQQMMAMAGASAGGGAGNNLMEDVMANTWASRDLRETVNRAASARGNRRNRSSSSSNNNNNGGGGNNNSSANNDGNRRRRTGSRSRNNHNDSDDDEVQVVDEHGNVVGETMEESDEDSYHYNDDSDDDDSMGGGNNASIQPNNNNRQQNNQPPNLSTMFQPPIHLIHRAGGFLGAKNFAKDARRWLLVNIQSEDDFACHALNRDVWHDELVENLVREGFVFWQVHSTHPEGMTYCQRYKVEGRYPHIAIIDPRTGSLLYRKEGWTQVNPLTAEQFVEIASDFCSRHSFDKAPMPARHGYANGGGGGMGGDSRPPAKRPVHELSEQEQLEAAIRASMQDASGEQQSDDDDDDDEVQVLEENDVGDNVIGKSIEEDTSTSKSSTQDNNLDDSNNKNDDDKQDEESKVSPFLSEIVSMTVPTEPTTTGPTIARVQLRMPNGKRFVRKFDGDSPVKVIYAYVAQLESNIEDARSGKMFELKAKFPPVDLMPFVEDSISSVGLSGEAITFLWK